MVQLRVPPDRHSLMLLAVIPPHFAIAIGIAIASDVGLSKAGKMPALPGQSAHEMKLFILNRYLDFGHFQEKLEN